MKTRSQARPNLALRQQRKKRHWTQTELARMLGTTYLSVCRWENGATVPSLYYCKRLCELFALSAEELGLIASPDRAPEVTPAALLHDKQTGIWRVPHHRNPFFTGRTSILDQLYTLLHTNQTGAAGCALSGLGGMGKTQIAIEYAFRQRDSYQTILWFNAETREVFSAEVANLARQLKLLGPEEQDSHYAYAAISRWLELQENCLLILDNVEDVALIETLLPANFRGHILLTTRRQAPGLLVQRLDIDELSMGEGALFLLQRARFLALGMGSDAVAETTFQQAKAICTLLGGLPLALDQAGAYIEETGCSLLDYLEHFQVSRSRLLLRRGQSGGTHPEAISTTVALCLEKIASEQPAALELLRCCVWLTPDAIPEELFTRGAPDLGPLLAPLADDV
ncbi:MAG TPA: helix-turn-helix domain-containing protein, partial [Ktedonobacteraceae bacterium]|nr:helix-turn-helix domain-containing protein [Ktedonobacteraceae bacterium]